MGPAVQWSVGRNRMGSVKCAHEELGSRSAAGEANTLNSLMSYLIPAYETNDIYGGKTGTSAQMFTSAQERYRL